jgi:two-component system, LuxR family, response regulator FixJ
MLEQSVYVVDDDYAVRRSLSIMLRMQGYRVAAFPDAETFLPWIATATPGCILIDYRLPGMDGLALQRRLTETGIAMPVVLMTGHGDIPFAVRAMRAGALHVLEKPYEKDALLEIIREGQARLGGTHQQAARRDVARARIEVLTSRERDVLSLLVAGLPNKAIAQDLGISPRTVEIHRAHVMEKLGARSLSTALQIAMEAGISQLRSAAS